MHGVHDIYIVKTIPLRTWIRFDEHIKTDCLPNLANSVIHINYANELEVPVPCHKLHGWEPTPMCIFSQLFLYFQYWHVFSLQSRDTTMFTSFSHSLWTKISIPKLIPLSMTRWVILVTQTGSFLPANRNNGVSVLMCSCVSKFFQKLYTWQLLKLVDKKWIWLVLCKITEQTWFGKRTDGQMDEQSETRYPPKLHCRWV